MDFFNLLASKLTGSKIFGVSSFLYQAKMFNSPVSYAKELYEFFGVSETDYPYCAVGILADGRTRVYFSKEPLNNSTSVPYTHYTLSYNSELVSVTDAKIVVEWIKLKSVSAFTSNNANYTTVPGVYFANYQIENTDTVTCYKL